MRRAIPWRHPLLWLLTGALGAALLSSLGGDAPGRGDGSGQAPAAADFFTASRTAPGLPAHQQTASCYVGVVLAEETVDLAAEAEGQLRQVEARVGDRVQAGEVIASLDTTSLRHQLTIERATLRSSQAEMRRQRIDVGRAKQEHRRRLALEGLLSQEEEEKARFQAETAGALFEAAEAEVQRVEARIAQLETRLQRSQIRAPFNGTVAQRYLDPGAVVGPGTPILRLISGESLLARFAIEPEDIDALGIGTAVRVEVETLDLSLDGIVEHLAPEIDAASQLLFVEARIHADSLPEASLPSGAAARIAIRQPGGAPLPSCLGSRP